MNILIAPNAFKNSLNATDAAKAIQTGLTRSSSHYKCECFPIGDGGDGTAKLIVEKCTGAHVNVTAHDALGRVINTSFGLINNGTTAVIEMADASGIRVLSADELAPLRASSYGTGELIRFALDRGVSKIILGMGGSATVDGGIGILSALGIRFFKSDTEILPATPENLVDMDRIDSSGLDQRILATELTILCDVDNKLLGDAGAAAVFGPQKGASDNDLKKLELILSSFRDIAFKQTGKDMALVKHGGTAGGAAAGLHTFINAGLVNGIDHFLEITGFDETLKKFDIVITGEGSIDEQTLQGKGPFGVAYRAKLMGKLVIALAGKVPLSENKKLHQYFDVLLPIGNEPSGIEAAIQSTAANLERTSFEIGSLLKFV